MEIVNCKVKVANIDSQLLTAYGSRLYRYCLSMSGKVRTEESFVLLCRIYASNVIG